jgi:hypothetical protein
MTAVSAVNPFRVAQAAALNALPIIGGPASPRVYHTKADRDAALPYIVIDGEQEDESGARYNQGGQGLFGFMRCWGIDSWEAQEVYNAAKGALHGVSLAVTGFKNVRPQVERLTGFLDRGAGPDDLGPYCVVGQVTGETKL